MIAGAHILINTETRLHHAFAVMDGLGDDWPFAALLVEHAFGCGDDDLGAFLARGQRLAQGVAHARHIIGAIDPAHPVDADTLDRILDAMPGRASLVAGPRGKDV